MMRAFRVMLFALLVASPSLVLAETAHHESEAHEVAEHATGHDDGHGELTFSSLIRSRDFQGTMVNFLVLVGLIAWVIRKKGNPALAARRAEVEKELAEAQRLRAEAEKRHMETATRLQKLDDEMLQIRGDMIKAGEAERDRIVEQAEEKAARLRKDTSRGRCSAGAPARADHRRGSRPARRGVPQSSRRGARGAAIMSALGRRYAKALLELAREQGELDPVLRDVGALSDAWNVSPELREIVRNPVVPKPALKAAVDAVMEKLGCSKLVRNTVNLLADKGRLAHLEEVLHALEELAEAETGRVRVEVVSAKPLNDAYYARLTEKLKRVTDREVVLVKKQDPSLIGGVVTRVGDQVFDGSLSDRLSELRETLLANGETP
jgi:F-type H+-transporting ATPase subunit delta